ncbi:MAG: zinc ribbon domain-containing protein [Acidobacteriia bacterium]|nr:zinc ribbon domain-containing protein [Terriglobia bacterium]
MPLFEYECRGCKTRFERLVFDRAAEIVCRECGSTDVAQLLSTFAVGAESAKAAPQAGPCEGCQGMQGGTCPMNQ